MSNILVNFGQVADGAAGMAASQSQIDNLLNEMESKLNTIRERWDGAAQASYSEAQLNWDRAADEMNEILAVMSQLVAQSGENFNNTDQSAARLFG